ncbi:Multidrug efflux pump subunit AcrA (membrane-fusion protein) [Lentzea albidocapillata subsp. violacea]|uniref:Multidrug efflux pump subunit AcrA (Membrane-fusion protein) n=1 Tax=Lentzea albidocapillata subsp. violacea TaxID=128104 RepID=A0A1G9NFL1_9PSEU|nr:peptidoglycan-binding protein [Lentzea albidocapillata]SDL85184.1 Multidrug efflux pump subunit AcrA (membrane-fusion protein) [Lentzea albidocapillata subsp. violacea]
MTEPHEQSHQRPRKRRWPYVVLTASIVVAVGVTGVLVLGQGSGAKTEKGNQQPAGKTAPIDRSTLVEQEELDGKLGYAGKYDVTAAGGGGVITWLPKVGDPLGRGDAVYRVNDKPVPLLFGDKPFWRKLESGMEKGSDVLILEQNLNALGYAGFTVDEKFDTRTVAAVKKWQKKLGVEQTGWVDPSSVVVQPDTFRVSSVDVPLGSPAQGKVLSGTGTKRLVTVEVPVARQTLVQEGAQVEVRLPGGKTTTTGKITKVGTVADKPESDKDANAGAVIKVEVELDDVAAAGKLDGAPVDVLFISRRKENVLTVPVGALLALAEGGYAVEIVQPDGTGKLVAVELGMFAKGKVEVSGSGLDEGATVKVAGL